MKILSIKEAKVITNKEQKSINGGIQLGCDDNPNCHPPRPIDCSRPSCEGPGGLLVWCRECINDTFIQF